MYLVMTPGGTQLFWDVGMFRRGVAEELMFFAKVWSKELKFSKKLWACELKLEQIIG